MRLLRVTALLVVLFSWPAEAKRFQNAYVSFDLPANWSCSLEATEWVCISDYQQRAKEAIIILTAKQVGPTDNIEAYAQHLKTLRQIPNPSGATTPSKVIHVNTRTIANHPWVDGLQLGSEVVSYYTRYLATTKEGIAILVTFSAHQAHYTKYSQDFLRAIESLRVVATRDLLNKPAESGIRPGHETIGAPIGAHIPSMEDVIPEEASGGSKGNFYLNLLVILILIGAIGAYFYMRSKKGKGKAKSK